MLSRGLWSLKQISVPYVCLSCRLIQAQNASLRCSATTSTSARRATTYQSPIFEKPRIEHDGGPEDQLPKERTGEEGSKGVESDPTVKTQRQPGEEKKEKKAKKGKTSRKKGNIKKLKKQTKSAATGVPKKAKSESTMRKAKVKPKPKPKPKPKEPSIRKILTSGKEENEAGASAYSSAFGHGQMSLKEALDKAKGTEQGAVVRSDVESVTGSELELTPIDVPRSPVPRLAHDLDRVLFNPGVYHLQDPRSRVYNFDPYLQKPMSVPEFDFSALNEYITSSKDETLSKVARQYDKRYIGSTSSMTSTLAHFHYLLSGWRPINTTMVSRGFPERTTSFTLIQRSPASIFLRWKDGVYAIDADKEFDSANILSMLGKSMEKLLTLPPEDFERYRRTSEVEVPQEMRTAPEAYHYSTYGEFLMRSQLDAHDDRLPGTGMFDLKTRAVVTIRMDVRNHEHGMGYEIKSPQGEWESFEREYFDMMRATMLKYSLQVRMGRMDGIFLMYHNIERIFGFQYVSLPEMDNALHGQDNTILGDQEFKISLELLNKVLDRAIAKFPEQSIRLHFETREASVPFMYVFAEPVTEEDCQRIQATNVERLEEFERSVLGLDKKTKGTADVDSETEDDSDGDWEKIRSRVERVIENEQGFTGNDVGEEKGVFEGSSEDARSIPAGEEDEDEDEEEDEEERSEEDGEEDEEKGEDQEEQEGDEDDGSGDSTGKDAAESEAGVEEKQENFVNSPASGEAENVIEHSDHSTTGPRSNVEATPVEDEQTAAEGGISGGTRLTPTETSSPSELAELDGSPSDSPATTSKLEGAEIDTGETADLPAESAAPEKASEDSSTSADAKFLDSLTLSTPESVHDRPLLAMTLTVRSIVNKAYVPRPADLKDTDKWTVEYSIAEISKPSRAWALYGACQTRRRAKLSDVDAAEGDDSTLDYYRRRMREMSKEGRAWRKKRDREDRESGKGVVMWDGARGGTGKEVQEEVRGVDDYMDWLYGVSSAGKVEAPAEKTG